MKVKHIDHLNLSVRSFAETAAWYERVFGFAVVEDGMYNGRPWGVLLSGDAMLCAYEDPSRACLDGEELKARGLHGVNHFALRITDSDKMGGDGAPGEHRGLLWRCLSVAALDRLVHQRSDWLHHRGRSLGPRRDSFRRIEGRISMVIYLYRWKLKPEKIEEFTSAWMEVTSALREHCGSLGSRLHRGSDGLFYGYAQWPSREAREQASLDTESIRHARSVMRNAAAESLPDIVLDPVSDFLIITQSHH